MIAAIMATVCAGAFAGAAVYVSVVEHPARLSCGTVLALREFAPSYRRGTLMQVPLALVGLVSSIVAWWQADRIELLIGGLLLGSVVPFTLLAILPTNHRLLAADLEPDSAEAEALLQRWGTLHAVRSVLGALAFVALVVCSARS